MLQSQPALRASQLHGKNQERKPSARLHRSRKLTVAIVGAGRLGTALGLALRASGHTLGIVVTRSTRSARRASRLLETNVLALGSKEVFRLPPAARDAIWQSDLMLITTPDDSIPQVANQLAKLSDLYPINAISQRKRVALHTSGALTSELLSPLKRLGVATGSLHPLISISGQPDPARIFAGIHFALEGNAAAIRAGKRIVRDLGGDSFVIKVSTKPLYHAAAVMAAPNLNSLIDIAIEMLTRCGLSPSRARQILLPLISSTVSNLTRQTPQTALTGTFKRGDIETVKVHLAAIASERLTDAMRAYVTLGKRSLTISGIPKSKQRAIESLLTDAAAHLK